jgi:hypothetical protein
MFAHDAGPTSAGSNIRFGDDHVSWEWRYTGRDSASREIHLHGCDLFVFVGDKIAVKQAFRKVLSE